MNSKKWIRIWLFSGMFVFLSIGIFNYLINPFEIFHTKILKYRFQMNERFIKINHLDKNYDKYNSYIFGSSRVGTTHPEVIEKYISDSKFYNFTISNANLYDHIMHLKYFLYKKYPIKNLYLQIDLNNMSSYGNDKLDYLRRLHPSVVNESLVAFYLEYLFNFFPFNTKGKIKQNLNNINNGEYFFETTGIWTREKKEQKIIENCNEYVSSEPSFNKLYIRNKTFRFQKETLSSLKDIKKICHINNINLYVYITPHNQKMMDEFIISDYLKFLKFLSKITDFYNFSAYNSITTNNCNYYEHSHYRPHVGKLIAAKIFNDPIVNTTKDFGVFVTKYNVEEYLESLKRQIENRREPYVN